MTGDGDGEESINDAENYSDKKIKERLHQARKQITSIKNQLNAGSVLDPSVNYTQHEINVTWANLVQTFLQDINVLLEKEELAESEYYRDEVELGKVLLIPRDTDDIPFSEIVYEDVSAENIIARTDKLSRGAKLPRPEPVPFNGLQQLARADIVLEHHWSVVTNPRAPDHRQEVVHTATRKPIDRDIFERAMEHADIFLDKNGIGLDTSQDGVPEFGWESVGEEDG